MPSRPKSRKRDRIGFFCKECGGEQRKWFGRCPECGAWNSLVEAPDATPGSAGARPVVPAATAPRVLRGDSLVSVRRTSIGMAEIDRTLGGGLVPGAVILLGGDPGVGKSTLAMQAAGRLAERGERCVYVSGEESREQVALRAERVGSGFADVLLASGTSVPEIEHWTREHTPRLLVVDSIQTAHTPEAEGAPGSVGQVRESGLRLHALAKSLGTATVLIGHVTKDGGVAGPRLLEHMVDAVLYLEGERIANFRVLRAVKNRFGSTDEIGIFEMRETGLVEVEDPSKVLGDPSAGAVPGSAAVPTIEGTRPILLEVQALVTPTAYGTPQRVTSGVDPKRLAVLLAVLRKHAGVDVTDQDIFVNVVAGIRVNEPAVDLGVVMAVASSHAERALPEGVALFGEIGLSGEVRPVSQASRRVAEASRVGFTRVVVPKRNLEDLSAERRVAATGVASIGEALDALGLGGARKGRRRRGRNGGGASWRPDDGGFDPIDDGSYGDAL